MGVFACSDLHGRYDLYQEIMKFIKPDDKLYCLGDCIDRGPDGWKLLKEILSNPQITLLKGNHEDLLCDAIRFMSGYEPKVYIDPVQDCVNNGGAETLQSWMDEGAKPDWIYTLRRLPIYENYENTSGYLIHLTHAGFTPTPDAIDEFDAFWDRKHIADEWPEGHENEIVVHGHTPIGLVDLKWRPEDGAMWYANCHKINIDMGAYDTGFTLLLDLDTFDEHIFQVEEGEE